MGDREKEGEKKKGHTLFTVVVFKAISRHFGIFWRPEEELMLNSFCILTALYNFQFETKKYDLDVF